MSDECKPAKRGPEGVVERYSAAQVFVDVLMQGLLVNNINVSNPVERDGVDDEGWQKWKPSKFYRIVIECEAVDAHQA